MADISRRYTGGLTLFSLLAGIICTTFCLNVICNQNYQTNGLAIIHFNSSLLEQRGVPFSVPTIPAPIPGANAPTLVSGAITSLETAVGSIMPQNCSLGVRSYCISFTDRVDCRTLPLALSSMIPSSVTAGQQSGGVHTLDKALSQITPQRIKDCLVAGAIFAGLATALSIWSLIALRMNRIFFFPWALGAVCSVICSIPLLVPTIILYGMCLEAKLPKGMSLEMGEATHQILAALIFAQLLGASVVFGTLLDRYGELLF